MTSFILISTAISFVLILLSPDIAIAWGPGTHLTLGSMVLGSLQSMGQDIVKVLSVYSYDYLYGCIGADILIDKKFMQYRNHCHNWRMGFKILDHANEEFQLAFAYGYLSHLAADTIAHNLYVPLQMVNRYMARTRRHSYWEIHFEAFARKDILKGIREIVKKSHRENNELLEEVLHTFILSFKTNKAIFNGIMLLNRIERWQRILQLAAQRSPWKLSQEEVEGYLRLSFKSIMDILTMGNNAPCLKSDPIGRENIQAAKKIRKRLKSLSKAGHIDTSSKWSQNFSPEEYGQEFFHSLAKGL